MIMEKEFNITGICRPAKHYMADVSGKQQLVRESNTNFDSLVKNLEHNLELYDLVCEAVVNNENFPFSIHDPLVQLGVVYGIFDPQKGFAIHNLVYSEVIINYMASKMARRQSTEKIDACISYRLPDNGLNMELVLTKFQQFMQEQYSRHDRDFLERQGRLSRPATTSGGYLLIFDHAETKSWRSEWVTVQKKQVLVVWV
jgi:hypothetical protein